MPDVFGLSSSPRLVLASLVTVSALASGCVHATGPTQSPAAHPVAPAPATPRAAPAPTLEAVAQVDDADLPVAAECRDAMLIPEDQRCPHEILHAAALSWLNKTTAVFDGVEVELIEYDPNEIRAEAEGDLAFRRMLADADAAPRDGRLDGAEARDLEQRVLDRIDAQYAAR